MAFYFTLAIECYREADAARISEQLRPLVVSAGVHRIPMAVVRMSTRGNMWYVTACPKGPGYSQYGYGDGLNDPEIISEIIDQVYLNISNEDGIRRALCGYEAQDAFEDGDGSLDLDRFDLPDLIYDRDAASSELGAKEFGSHFYRNPSARFRKA
jgi:hypothetical protein